MADSIEVTLTLGYDHLYDPAGRALHEYLIAPLGVPAQRGGESGQHLTLVAGQEVHPDGLPGSGQAGAIRIYAGLLRRGCSADVIDYLRSAPWGSHEAVVVIHEVDGPATIERLGYAPAEPGWGM